MTPGASKDTQNRYGEGVAQFSVRMPDELHTRIKEAAAKDGVSLNVWLCLIAAEKVAGSLRAEDAKRLDALEQRIDELEREL